jgi:hypothetical protein
MSILCRIGLHRWRVVGWKGLVVPAQVQQCASCGIGRAVCFDCVERYTAEQMAAALHASPAPDKDG